jgi:hypothetical protein
MSTPYVKAAETDIRATLQRARLQLGIDANRPAELRPLRRVTVPRPADAPEVHNALPELTPLDQALGHAFVQGAWFGAALVLLLLLVCGCAGLALGFFSKAG